MSSPSLAPGATVGLWTVIGEPFGKRLGRRVRCRCECGTEKDVQLNNLRAGRSRGCVQCRNKKRSSPLGADLRVGERFGRLTILSVRCVGGISHATCRCECGNETTGRLGNIVSGGKQSCGCLLAERRGSIKHGMSGSHEYGIYQNMIRRCHNENDAAFRHYGARGIRVCERWLESFENFYEDMGARPSKKHSLDRIDNDGHYEPGNCRWATWKQQAQNTRRNVWIEHNGLRMTASDWAKRCGVSRQRIEQRMAAGMPIEKVVAPNQTVAPRTVRAFGKELSISEWASLLGLSYMCILNRLKSYPPEVALSPTFRSSRAKRPGRLRCSNCGQKGHNRRTCAGKSEAA